MQFASYSSRTLALLRLRARPATGKQLYDAWLAKNEIGDIQLFRLFQPDAIEQLLACAKDAEKHLDVLASGYKAGVLSEPYSSHQYSRRDLLREIPVELAMEIVEQADRFPGFLVAAAERRCRAETAKRIRPVGKVAEEDGWFKPSD